MDRPENEVMRLRREVGAALATSLDSAGMSRGDLARATNYHRTSISHVLSGRQFPERRFWMQADATLYADGALLSLYDDVRARLKRVRRRASDRKPTYVARENEHSGAFGAESPLLRTSFDPEVEVADGPIDSTVVEGLHSTVAGLVQLDQQYGGSVAAPVVVEELRRARNRVAHSELRPGTRSDVYAVLAEIAEVAGWSAYDAGHDTLAERANNEALSLARIAGDRNMELFVLQNMAMHAESTGRAHESVNIGRLVLDSHRLSPRVEALFRFRLARAYARLRAGEHAAEQMSHALALFGDGVRDTDPHWAWWVNEPQVAWFRGAVALDLGRNAEALDAFARAAEAYPEPRMNFIYRSWLIHACAVNESWPDVEDGLRRTKDGIGHFRSRRAEDRLARAANIVLASRAPKSVRDLAVSVRAALTGTVEGHN